jgi:predicted ATPase
MSEVQNRIVGIVGRKGSGKSTRLGELLRYCPRFIGFDPMGEHAREKKVNKFDSPGQLAQFLKNSRQEETFAGAYVPGGDLEEEIEEVARLVYARGQLCFACEEVLVHPGRLHAAVARKAHPHGQAP